MITERSPTQRALEVAGVRNLRFEADVAPVAAIEETLELALVEVLARVGENGIRCDACTWRPTSSLRSATSFIACLQPFGRRRARAARALRKIEQAGRDELEHGDAGLVHETPAPAQDARTKAGARSAARRARRRAASAHRRGGPAPATSGIRARASRTIPTRAARRRRRAAWRCSRFASRWQSGPFQRPSARARRVRVKPLRIVRVREREDLALR